MVLVFMNHQNFTFFMVGICVSIVFGISMSVLIETSSIRLRDKLFPSKDSALDRKRIPVERATSDIGIVGVAAEPMIELAISCKHLDNVSQSVLSKMERNSDKETR